MTAVNKSLSIATVLEKSRLASDVPFLILLDVEVRDPAHGGLVETLRLVRNAEDIVFDGNTYIAAHFDLDLKEEGGGQPTVSLSILDYTKVVMQRMELYGGGIGFSVMVTVIRAHSTNMPNDKPEVQVHFQVVGASASEYSASFTLGSENALMRIFPRRLQSKDFCAWRYKDPTTCRYSGGLVGCDLTLNGPNGCKAHFNEPNFGAFPGISNSGSRYV